ncbi:aldehyde dehydrogenase [Bacteriovoracaceae bacterium]|nr:aldehyde dehydrogenase [Bacteriovoracaceae bacterium]
MEESQIQTLFQNSKTFANTGISHSYEWRVEALKRLEKVILLYEKEIIEALRLDLGKSEFEGYVSEVGFTLSEISHTIKKLKKWMRPKKVSSPLIQFPCRSYINFEPLGTVLIIAPWNYPFNLLMAPLIGALSAGNNAILKPSEISVHTSKICEKIISDAFTPEEVIVIQGEVKETTALLELPFDHIFYTGNGSVGRIVMEKAAKNLVPVTLELGGKSPCMVLGENDLEIVGRRIAWGKFFNAGQTCVAPDYIIVEKKKKSALEEAIKNGLNSFYGKEVKSSPDYGRIINERHWNRLKHIIDESEVSYGGDGDKSQKYISPTLINADSSSASMKDEIFGPLLPIVTVENTAEAIEFINSSDKPLACYLFTKDKSVENTVVKKVSSGGLCINDSLVHLSSQTLPFGGVGESGMGRYHGRYSFETFSHQKAVMKRYQIFDILVRYPPYLGKLKIIKWLLKL